MRRIAFLFLLFPLALSAQEGCELFNLQELAAENLVLHDSIANFAVDTVILQPDGSFEVQLSNGTTFTQVLGCTDPTYVEYDSSANTDDGSCSTLATWCSSASTTMDGYSYNVVEIGDQCWFAENLRTTVYANGDAIPAALTDWEWTSTTVGASAIYGEGSSTCYNDSPDIDACDEAQSLEEYGRLYNWYAVDDARGLCPAGWHVPTDGEWMVLEMELGMSESEANATGWRGTDEGTQLKSTFGWHLGNGTDDFGFSALPGGWRGNFFGDFDEAGNDGYWWSSSLDGFSAWRRRLLYTHPTIFRGRNVPRYGFSVRCLMNTE